MKILASSTDIAASDAAMALKSVLAPKKVKSTNSTTTDDEEEEDLVNDEETTRNIMNSAIDMTTNIMKAWKDGSAEFDISDLTSMLEATFAINDEYAGIAKHNARTYTTEKSTNDTTIATDATGATDATNETTNTTVKVVSDYEKEKGK
jgi:hypothetical protein